MGINIRLDVQTGMEYQKTEGEIDGLGDSTHLT